MSDQDQLAGVRVYSGEEASAICARATGVIMEHFNQEMADIAREAQQLLDQQKTLIADVNLANIEQLTKDIWNQLNSK